MSTRMLNSISRFMKLASGERLVASLILCISLSLLNTGCAVKQPPSKVDSLKAALAPSTSVPPAWQATGGTPGAVADWLPAFQDPTLEALVTEGLKNNLDLRAAVARVDIAAGLATQARSQLYPYIGAIGGEGVVGRDSINNKSGIGMEVSWELDVWGRVRSQAASGKAGQQASEADLLSARQSLAALITKMWYQAVAAERLRTTAQDFIKVYEELQRLVILKNNVGQVGKLDVAEAQADLERARRRERQYATSEQQTVRALETILGRYPADSLALPNDLAHMPPPVPAGIPSELLERRPDLVAAERRVASAFYMIQSAQAARLPRIALTLSGGHSSNDLFYLLNVNPWFWQAGANFLAPLYMGGALKAQVTIATAQQEAALSLYGQTALRAFNEVETALANEQLLAEQQRHLEIVLQQDTEALRLGRIRYNVGATDLLSVLDLQTKQLNTQTDLISLRSDRLSNRVGLYLALGGGFTQTASP